MDTYKARIDEICLDVNQEPCAWVACEPKAVPSAGRYLMAHALEDEDAPLATPIFACKYSQRGFLAAAPVPSHWQPGMSLMLTGPCGHGFELPPDIRRLAVAILGNAAARMLPVILDPAHRERSVAVFANCNLPVLPVEIEINPLDALPALFNWADYLVCEVPLENLDEFRTMMRLPEIGRHTSIPGQALVFTPMPCGGVSECGACALSLGKAYQYVCKDGPVFTLQELLS